MSTLKPSDITIVVDTREQRPLDFAAMGVKTVTATLKTGDYSVLGLEHELTIERKSLSDLVACCGRERERFDRVIQRMLDFKCRCVVIESPWADIAFAQLQWRSRLTANHVYGSCTGWMAYGVPFHFAQSRLAAARFVVNLCLIHARRSWRDRPLPPESAPADIPLGA